MEQFFENYKLLHLTKNEIDNWNILLLLKVNLKANLKVLTMNIHMKMKGM